MSDASGRADDDLDLGVVLGNPHSWGGGGGAEDLDGLDDMEELAIERALVGVLQDENARLRQELLALQARPLCACGGVSATAVAAPPAAAPAAEGPKRPTMASLFAKKAPPPTSANPPPQPQPVAAEPSPPPADTTAAGAPSAIAADFARRKAQALAALSKEAGASAGAPPIHPLAAAAMSLASALPTHRISSIGFQPSSTAPALHASSIGADRSVGDGDEGDEADVQRVIAQAHAAATMDERATLLEAGEEARLEARLRALRSGAGDKRNM